MSISPHVVQLKPWAIGNSWPASTIFRDEQPMLRMPDSELPRWAAVENRR
jgi:hypothetical protein